MTVKELKQFLSNVSNDLEIIVIDNKAKEYKVFGCSETNDTFLKTHPQVKKQFFLEI